jgi:hypothetical protein
MNIYKTEGLKIAEIDYGWGMDLEAIEFPVEWAREGLELCILTENLKEIISGDISIAAIDYLIDHCIYVIENSEEGDVYILDCVWKDLLDLINKIKKLIAKRQIYE